MNSATVTASAWYDIEAGYDYLYAEYSTNAVTNWTQIGAPLDGSSKGHWKGLRYTVPGGSASTLFRFRYQTDGGVHLAGAFIDDIVIKVGKSVFTDSVESGANGWTAEPAGSRSAPAPRVGRGSVLHRREPRVRRLRLDMEIGAYQFSFALTDPEKVEHFAFEDGLLVWMVDESYSDNNNSEHTGHGLALPVDARPAHSVLGWLGAEQSAPAVRRDVRSAGSARRPDGRSGERDGPSVRRPAQADGRREGQAAGDGVPVRVA